MFDGSFKSSRKVSLSGRRTPLASSSSVSSASLSKDELLLQSKKLREERLAQRRRAAAATAIQALCRRVATARRARARVLQELEAQLAALVGPQAAPLPVAQLQGIVRKFLFAQGRFFNPHVANAQSYVVVLLLVSALQGAPPHGNILAAAKDRTWVFQTARVLESCLRVLVSDGPNEQLRATSVVLLETFTARERYVAAGAVDVDQALPLVLRQLALRDAVGTFEALRRLILMAKPDDRVAQLVVRLAVLSLEPVYAACGDRNASQDPVLAQFTRKIVLTPGALSSPLVQRVLQGLASTTAGGDKTTRDSAFWEAVLSVLCGAEDKAASTALSWSEGAVAVGNVLDLIVLSAFSPRIVARGSAVLARLVSRSHIRWVFDAEPASSLIQPTVRATDDVDMDDDENDAFALSAAHTQLTIETVEADENREVVQKEIQSLVAWQRGIQTQWQQLYDTTFVQRLFDALAATSVDALRDVSHVYATLLLGLGRSHLLSVRQSFKLPPPAFSTFLSAVSREQLNDHASVPIVKRLWELVRASIPSGSSTAHRASDAVLQPLLLFNAVYSHLLLTLDDETFYDRAWPFQLRDIAEIVAFLKQFIFDVCWNANGTTRTSSATTSTTVNANLFPALTTSVKLFNQLYDRDCRRRFAPEGAWLWPSMPVIRETVDLESMEGDLYELQALSSLMSPTATLTPHARASLILTTIPQVFSFNDRVQLFEKLLDEEKRNLEHVRNEFSRALQVRVKRDEIVDDSFAFFDKVCNLQSPSALKSRIKVTFVNEQGLEEAGIDGGGVFKEYVDQLTKSAFSPEYGFFLATTEQLLYPNPAARLLVDTPKDVTDRFRFLGRVLGKAVYEGILVEPQFAAFFLNKLLGKYNYIDDLHSLDPDLYRNLMQLKHYTGNVEELALTFSVSEKEFGQVVTRHLVPDGANLAVTNDNKIRYIHLLANYKLNVLSSHESAAFLRGFRDLIPAKWIQMFSPSELQMLIGGAANKIDVLDWQRHTLYGGGYHPSQRPIQWFWDLVTNEFGPDDRAALLKFITSVSRQPLLGFGQLAPQICIHQVRIDDDERLPSSATCMNLLKLPTYSSKEIMKQKLLYAIRANAGFDLS